MAATSQDRSGYLSVLRVPGMPAVYFAHAVSMAGTLAAEVALSILVFQRTGSPLLSALVLVCTFLPYAVGGTFSGITDRWPARRVLVGCDLVSAGCVAAMLVPGIPVPALLGLLFVSGIVAPVFQGARAASLAQLLDAGTFPVGRSLLRTVSQTMVLVGFGLGGALVAAVGPTWLLAGDAVSFLLSAVLIGGWTPATPVSAPGEGRRVGGVRYVLAHRRLRRLLALSLAVPAFASVPDGLAVSYTAQTGTGPELAGVLFTGYAVGTVAGEIVVARLSPAARRRLVAPLALASQLPGVLFLVTPPLPLAALLLVVSGSGFAFNQGLDPLILAETEESHRGRLFTLQSSGLMTVQGVGIALAGVLGTAIGPGAVIGSAALTGAAVVLVLLRRAL